MSRIGRRVMHATGLAGVLASLATSRFYLILASLPLVALCLVGRFVVNLLGWGVFSKETVATFSNSVRSGGVKWSGTRQGATTGSLDHCVC